MNDIYEFLFCPVHGVFSVKNWPTLAPMAVSGAYCILHLFRIAVARRG